jgi:hypothetical protein
MHDIIDTDILGEVSDARVVDRLIAFSVAKPNQMLADKGKLVFGLGLRGGDNMRSVLLLKGILPIIPLRTGKHRTTGVAFPALQLGLACI